MVNNQIVTELGTQVVESDEVTVKGKAGKIKEDIYVAYNKPRGEVCSHNSELGDKTIFASLPKSFLSLKIAGRLDKDSEGLVILSSDGHFVNKVSHPREQKEKLYIVTTRQPVDKQSQAKLEAGVKLDDGLAKAYKTRSLPGNRVSLVLQEGRKRQIRRMFDAIDHPVVRLERIQVGRYRNDQLKPGEYVFIKPEDVL